MNKEQQIEEMARVACEHFDCDMVGQPCTKCKTYDKHCYTIHQAETLYNAGYRKTFASDFASNTQKAFKEGYIKGAIDRDIEIAELKAENERLTERLKQVLLSIDTVKEMNAMCNIAEQRKQAVKEFAEKLKKKVHNYYPSIDSYCTSKHVILVKDIDELLKEYEK